nr:acyl-CoA thioesterase domain-containing protein [Mycobacterium tuberculosis]
MPRSARFFWSNASATVDRSAPGGSTQSSTGKPYSAWRRRSRPNRRALPTKTLCQRRRRPDGLPGLNSIKVFDDAGFRQFDEWDVCIVPRERLRLLPGKASQQQVWLRHRDPLPDDPVLHICALAYMSDLTLLGSAQVNHLDVRDQLQVASLDHAMWFMRPFRADEWLLYDQSSPSASGGRALTRGEIFTRSGEMVAAVMQEGLTRHRRGHRSVGQ